MADKLHTIVVTGATGRQGGAVARGLLAQGWSVRAITRHPESAAAAQLRVQGMEVARGDLDDPQSLVAALSGAHGLFGVTDFWESGLRREVRQGMNLVDAARTAGLTHFVFSSVGGAERTQGLRISHFDSKREIEAYLHSAGIPYTIIRPVTFLENFISERFRRQLCLDGVLRFCIRPELPFQMVAMRDVGAFVALAFANPERYAGQAIELASDRFTLSAFAEAIGQAVGRSVRYQCIPAALQWIVAGYVGLTRSSGRYKVGRSLINQFNWNNTSANGGWNADIPALRELHPALTTMPQWVQSIDWWQGMDARQKRGTKRSELNTNNRSRGRS